MYTVVNYKDKTKAWYKKQQNKHLYYAQSWLEVLHQSYDLLIELVLDQDDNLIIAYSRIADGMGKRIVGLPFSDYIQGSKDDTYFYTTIFEFLSRTNPEFKILLKTTYTKDIIEQTIIVRNAVYHLIDLQTDPVIKQSKNFLRGVKKAKELAVTVVKNTDKSAINNFYQLYYQLRFDKFSSIPQPLSFFENIWEKFIAKNNGFVYEAILGDDVIASMIILLHDDNAYYKFGCSSLEHLNYKPNNILFSELICYLKQHNFKTLDLGLSGCSDGYAGLRRWKKDMGGQEHGITYFEKKAQNSTEQEADLNKAFKQSIHIITETIVQQGTDIHTTSTLSKILYPLFA